MQSYIGSGSEAHLTLSKRILPCLAAVGFLLSAADTYAQFGGGTDGIFGGGQRAGRGTVRGRDRPDRPVRPLAQDDESSQQIDYRLTLLQEDLHLTPGQEAPWQRFANRVRAYAGDLARERARAATPGTSIETPMSGIQHLERAAETAHNRATAIEEIAAAAKALYAALSDDQKRLADVRIATIVAPRTPRTDTGGRLTDLGPGGGDPH